MPGMKTLRKLLVKAAITGGFAAASMVLPAGVANANSGPNWDALAQCESNGNWSADTGNGFYGGLQFRQSTWEENGGVGSPAKASKAEQEKVANRVLATQGPDAWPKCGHKVGLTSGPHVRDTVKKIVLGLIPHL